MSKPKKYRFRYLFEPGEFPAPEARTQVRDDVSISHDDYGYTDDMVFMSVLRCPHGNIESVAFFSTISETDEGCSTEDLEFLRDQAQAEIDRRRRL